MKIIKNIIDSSFNLIRFCIRLSLRIVATTKEEITNNRNLNKEISNKEEMLERNSHGFPIVCEGRSIIPRENIK